MWKGSSQSDHYVALENHFSAHMMDPKGSSIDVDSAPPSDLARIQALILDMGVTEFEPRFEHSHLSII